MPVLSIGLSFPFMMQVKMETYRLEINLNTRRNGTKIEVPKIKLEAASKCTYFQGAIIFDELPTDTRKETNFQKI